MQRLSLETGMYQPNFSRPGSLPSRPNGNHLRLNDTLDLDTDYASLFSGTQAFSVSGRPSFQVAWLTRRYGLSPHRAALIASLAGMDLPGGRHD